MRQSIKSCAGSEGNASSSSVSPSCRCDPCAPKSFSEGPFTAHECLHYSRHSVSSYNFETGRILRGFILIAHSTPSGDDVVGSQALLRAGDNCPQHLAMPRACPHAEEQYPERCSHILARKPRITGPEGMAGTAGATSFQVLLFQKTARQSSPVST